VKGPKLTVCVIVCMYIVCYRRRWLSHRTCNINAVVTTFYRATACIATHGISKAFLSVCLSNACTVTKRNQLVPTFLYHMKERLS